MKNNIHDLEESLFEEWKKESIDLGDSEKEGKDLFAPDGLLYRGEMSNEKDHWEMLPGNENERWNKAPKRLLILTKELSNANEDGEIEEAWDIRVETGIKQDIIDYENCILFYKRLRMWTYGLLKMDSEGNYPDYEEACNMENSGPFYLEAPIARVNCKKTCGGSSISDSTLRKYIDKYKSFLIRQLHIYDDADIILCCNGSGVIKKFIQENYLNDLKLFRDSTGWEWIYYSPSTKKVLIDSWHPSDRKSYEDTYKRMMRAYSEFLSSGVQ